MSPRRDRMPPDPRHAAVKALLANYWAKENPAAPELPWGAAEAGCVGAFLRANPKLDVNVIAVCLFNRLRSEDHAPGEGIFRWFRDVLRYQAAPLDRFRLPKRTPSEGAIPYESSDRDPAAEKWFLDRARRRKANGESWMTSTK